MKRLILLLLLVSSACQSGKPTPTSPPTEYLTESVPATAGITAEPAASPAGVLILPTLTSLPPSAPTLEDYEPYTIDSLRGRTYGGGNIEVVETMEQGESFTRYLILYPSDGLNIYGFVNVPKGEGPFPVIVALHGFVDPAVYQTLDYTTSALDFITQTGYIVIHPNLRGYPPSDAGDSLFRVGLAVDVLNLIALIKAKSGPAELFGTAAPEDIGLWAHSMGGNIALRVLTVSSDVKAAVLFASMSGDERKNAELLSKVSPDPSFQTELSTPPSLLERISPMYYYRNITAPIQLHHGSVDQTVPVASAEETCNAITALHIQIECLYYPTEDHTFRSRVSEQVNRAMLGFYETYLSP